MPLFYNKVQRANPMDKEAPKKWYPVLKSVGMMNVQEVARLPGKSRARFRRKSGNLSQRVDRLSVTSWSIRCDNNPSSLLC